MKVELKDWKDNWQTIKDCTMTTISKDKGSYPDSEWKRKLLLCEHSPIRLGKIVAKFYDLYNFVSVHLVRHHEGFTPYVSSRRSDRGYNNQVIDRYSPVDMAFEANFQAIINISRKRLCNCASKETRDAWTLFLDEVVAHKEPELRKVCVPDCIYRGHCYEFKSCGYHKTKDFQDKLKEYREGIN